MANGMDWALATARCVINQVAIKIKTTPAIGLKELALPEMA